MTWMVTASGFAFDLLNLDAHALSVRDIAHSLAQINRYTGACVRPYSVAEHSLLVVEILEREGGVRDPAVLMAGLMHDAHEALVTDVSAPMKAALAHLAAIDGREASDWDLIEARHAQLLRRRFGVEKASRDHDRLIRWADLVALSTEWVHVMPATVALPDTADSHPPVEWIDIRSRDAMTWEDWRQAFIDKHAELAFALAENIAA